MPLAGPRPRRESHGRTNNPNAETVRRDLKFNGESSVKVEYVHWLERRDVSDALWAQKRTPGEAVGSGRDAPQIRRPGQNKMTLEALAKPRTFVSSMGRLPESPRQWRGPHPNLEDHHDNET